MIRHATLAAALLIPLAACVPPSADPASPRDGGPARPTSITPTAKPPVAPGPLPPNVTREVLPDGTVSITIRDQMLTMLREYLARVEGRYAEPGRGAVQ